MLARYTSTAGGLFKLSPARKSLLLRPSVITPLRSLPLYRFNGTIASQADAEKPAKAVDGSSVEHPSRDEATSIPDAEKSDDVEKTTGVIEQEDPRQGLVYYDRIYPFLFRVWWLRQAANLLLQRTKDNVVAAIKEQSIPEGLAVKIDKFLPREKDGGVFLSYTVTDPALTVDKADEKMLEMLNANAKRSWFNMFQKMRMFPVKGTPWLEDLRRTSTNKLKVEFEGADLSQEALYLLFRRYGPIIDIVPPAPGTKDIPRSAIVIFSHFRDAATARNCVNGVKLGETKVHILYQAYDHRNIIASWVMDHPRIVIPILVALLAGLAVIIFEPIRTFFIRKKICGKAAFDDYKIVRQLRRAWRQSWGFLGDVTGGMVGSSSGRRYGQDQEAEHLWDDRAKSADTLKQWVNEGVNTFIVVNGPRGSGKQNLVMDHALPGRANVFSIDCDQLIKSRSDSQFLTNASKVLGYFPVFPWMNSVAMFMDTIAQGLTGQKTGFAESDETQFKNMLTTAAIAITQTALENKKSVLEKTAAAEKSVGVDSVVAASQDGNENASVMSDETFLQLHPEERPVVVIKHFLGRSETRRWVYSQIAEWAGSLVTSNVAHVIFITADVSYDKILSNQLPNQVFKKLTIGDANKESAKDYILKQCAEQEKLVDRALKEQQNQEDDSEQPEKVSENLHRISFDGDELDRALDPLGGRMTDLQSFSRRLKSGEQPLSAVLDMIDQSCVEIVQMYLLKESPEWTRDQVWTLIKSLAGVGLKHRTEKDKARMSRNDLLLDIDTDASVPLGVLIQNANFKTLDQQKAIRALERAEMITTMSKNGRLTSIKSGRPIYLAAFTALLCDKGLSAYVESSMLEGAMAKEDAKIGKYEEELERLNKVGSNWRTKDRVNYISDKLYESQKKLMEMETRLNEQKAILATIPTK